MSLSILIDMNLSTEWVPLLEKAGWQAVHWSHVGACDADDETLIGWARVHKHIVFTHDLDRHGAGTDTRLGTQRHSVTRPKGIARTR